MSGTTRKYKVTTGTSRQDTNWRVREFTWEQIKKRLGRDNPTSETLAEYQALPKERRDAIKDCGGFVGGALRGRRRRKDAVICRSLVTLDLDKAEPDFWSDTFMMFCDYAGLVYSTHSYTPEKPRLRLVIPLDRDCTPEEYIAVARKVAEDVGINQMDKSTYQPERLMYYPSHPCDAEWVFEYQDGEPLSVDETLARYADWRDVSQYPTADDEDMAVGYEVKHVADPLEKTGIIGAFNRTYSISEAIDTFLSDIYVPGSAGRYTYVAGSSTNGAIVYNDDTILYSNHATDPAAGHAQNAYDLVRIHKFGDLDKHWDGNPAHKRPSDKAMADLIAADSEVSATLTRESVAACEADFADVEAIDAETGEVLPANKKAPPAASGEATEGAESDDGERSIDKLLFERDKRGVPLPTIDNFLLVLKYDPMLKNLGMYNRFTRRMEINGIMPWDDIDDVRGEGSTWNDADQAGFRFYCEKKYGLKSRDAAKDAVTNYFNKHAYHPVREYLQGLKWDGKRRVETLLIDYLGAEDTEYVRVVTRKMMAAGVKRIMEPGCKWDYMLTLTGAQGIGKSTMFQKLGKGWYDDSLTDVRTKDAYDQIQGVWIVEMAELTATRRADVEAVKQFISRQVDSYRKAYGEYKNDYPRECIFVGTTNDSAFLVDKTGNRRFWAVDVGKVPPRKSVWDDLTEAEVDQLWAEAKKLYEKGEQLYLNAHEAKLAEEMQIKHAEDDMLTVEIEDFLETKLPPDWDNPEVWSLSDRCAFWNFTDRGKGARGSDACTERRNVVCIKEIAVEVFGMNDQTVYRSDNKQLVRDIRRIMDSQSDWEKVDGQVWYGLYGGGRRDVYRRRPKWPLVSKERYENSPKKG